MSIIYNCKCRDLMFRTLDMLKIFGRVQQTKPDFLGADHGERTAQRYRSREPIQFYGLDTDVAPRMDRTSHGAPFEGFRTQQNAVVRHRRPEDRIALVDENGTVILYNILYTIYRYYCYITCTWKLFLTYL